MPPRIGGMPRKDLSCPNNTAVAALTLSLGAAGGREFQLTPAGEFRARDGRPEKLPGWKIDTEIASRLIAAAQARQTPLVVDYEHQTLLAEKNGQPAPASGWFHDLEWREGQGLFAVNVAWTERAAAMIAAGEYKFISPVFSYDPQSGAVREILCAALTNNPALDGMQAVTAALRSNFSNDEETHMKQLLAALGLPETATEAEALAALAALKSTNANNEQTIAALKLAVPDPAAFVPIAALKSAQDELAALKNAQHQAEVDALVNAGLADGRILPASEAWARDLGCKDIASLKSFLATATPIAALKGMQTQGHKPQGESGALSDIELAVCKAFGNAPEEVKKNMAAEAA